MRHHMLLIATVFVAACAANVGDDFDDDGTSDGTGTGNGSGTGGGSGSGNGSGNGNGNGGGTQNMTATRFLEQINMKFCDEAFTCKGSFPTDEGGTFDEAFGASQQV